MESCSLLKNVNLEEFIEENIPELEEDEDKTKRSFSFSNSTHEANELDPKTVHSVF